MKWKKIFKSPSSTRSKKPKDYELPQHEKLEEHNEKYFQKVTSRNKISNSATITPVTKNHNIASSDDSNSTHNLSNSSDKDNAADTTSNDIQDMDSNLNNLTSTTNNMALTTIKSNKIIALPKHTRDSTPIHHNRTKSTTPLPYKELITNQTTTTIKEYPFCAKVTCCTLTENHLAIGCDNGIVSIYSKKEDDYTLLQEIVKNNMKIRVVAYNVTNTYFAIGGDDCIASFYKIENEAYLHIKDIQRDDRVYTISFNHDGSEVAIGGFDGFVAIVTLSTFSIIKEISRLGLILCLDYSCDGMYLAIGGSDKCAAIVTTSNYNIDGEEDTHWDVLGEIYRLGSVQTLQWHPYYTILAMGGHDGIVTIVDIESRQIMKEILPSDTNNVLTSRRIQVVKYSHNGKYLAIGGTDDICYIYNTTNYDLLYECKRENHITCLCWNPNDTLIGIGGDDCIVAFYNMNIIGCEDMSQVTNSSYVSGPGGVTDIITTTSNKSSSEIKSISFSPNSFYVCYILNHQFYILTTNWTLLTKQTSIEQTTVLTWSLDSQYLALGTNNGFVHIYTSNDKFTTPIYSKQHFEDKVHVLQYNSMNTKLAIGSNSGKLDIVDVYLHYSIIAEYNSKDCITCIDWSKNGLYFAMGSTSKVITYECNHIYGNYFNQPSGSIPCKVSKLKFGVGGKFLAIGTRQGSITIYKFKDYYWIPCHEIKQSNCTINDMEWSCDDRYLAYGGITHGMNEYGGVVVDTISWEPLEEYMQNGSIKKRLNVQSLSWSWNGMYLAFGYTNGYIQVRNVGSWTVFKYINSLDYVGQEQIMKDAIPTAVDIIPNSEQSYQSTIEDQSTSSLKTSYEPATFLKVANIFLEPYNNYDTNPPSLLRSYISAIFMLECHIQYISTKSPPSNKKALELIYQLLKITTEVMEEVMDSNYIVDTWWTMIRKFDLDMRQYGLLQEWNSYWLDQNDDCSSNDIPLIDLELLASVDDIVDSGELDNDQHGEFDNDQHLEFDNGYEYQHDFDDAVALNREDDQADQVDIIIKQDDIIRTQDLTSETLYNMKDEASTSQSSCHVIALSSSQEQTTTSNIIHKDSNSILDDDDDEEEDLFQTDTDNPFDNIDAVLKSSDDDERQDRFVFKDEEEHDIQPVTTRLNSDAFSSTTMSDSNDYHHDSSVTAPDNAVTASSYRIQEDIPLNSSSSSTSKAGILNSSSSSTSKIGKLKVSSFESFKKTGVVKTISNDTDDSDNHQTCSDSWETMEETEQEEDTHDEIDDDDEENIESEGDASLEENIESEDYASLEENNTVETKEDVKEEEEKQEEEENFLARFGAHLKPVNRRKNPPYTKSPTNFTFPKKQQSKSPNTVSPIIIKEVIPPPPEAAPEYVSPSYLRSGRFEVTKTSITLPSYPILPKTEDTKINNPTLPKKEDAQTNTTSPPPIQEEDHETTSETTKTASLPYVRSGRFEVQQQKPATKYFSPYKYTNPSNKKRQEPTKQEPTKQVTEEHDEEEEDTTNKSATFYRTGRFEVSKKCATPTSFTSIHYVSPQQTIRKTISTSPKRQEIDDTNENINPDQQEATPTFLRTGRFQVSKRSTTPTFTSPFYYSKNTTPSPNVTNTSIDSATTNDTTHSSLPSVAPSPSTTYKKTTSYIKSKQSNSTSELSSPPPPAPQSKPNNKRYNPRFNTKVAAPSTNTSTATSACKEEDEEGVDTTSPIDTSTTARVVIKSTIKNNPFIASDMKKKLSSH